ncbi:hypothetical protein [Massilia sp. YMA4]|uniref:hypothetical protein n=1 Tax=Massilia sp. YMA4 TaxID=1593482 RepID=UPI001583A0AD|nr:hypothetical protein [Massilia sp. YMA4]
MHVKQAQVGALLRDARMPAGVVIDIDTSLIWLPTGETDNKKPSHKGWAFCILVPAAGFELAT